MINIPEKWILIELKELISFIIGGDWGKDTNYADTDYTDVFCIRGSEFRNWAADKGSTASLRKVKKSSLETRILKQGDILVEISGGGPEQPVGRTVLIDKTVLGFSPNTPKICTNFLRLMRPYNHIDSQYLNYYLDFFYKSGEVVKYQGGSNNLRNLKFNDYQTIQIPISPLNEQKRIVAKIEELFSELDKGIESLKTAREQLKIYRQAVLRHAFEGKLTADWRGKNKISTKWATSILGKSGKWLGGGTPSKAIPSYWENGHILWVSPKDMKSRFITDTLQKITPLGEENSSAKRTLGESILFVVRSGILRRILPIAIAVSGVTVNQDMQALIPSCHNTKFLYWYCEAHEKTIRHECSKDGTTVESIEVPALKNFPVPVPTIHEQEEIVRILESYTSIIETIEITIETELQKSEVLRQAILKKAFSGQLVPQDPNDEPASVLLERIKAEKSQSIKTTGRKKSK